MNFCGQRYYFTVNWKWFPENSIFQTNQTAYFTENDFLKPFSPKTNIALHRIRSRIWKRKKKKKRRQRDPQRKKKNSPHENRKNTKNPNTKKKKKKEPAEEEPRKTKKNNRPSEEKEEHEEERKSSFKYSVSTWIFFFIYIRLASHSTWVLKTQVPPLNSSFRNSKC